MARKNLLKGLMEEAAKGPSPEAAPDTGPDTAQGAAPRPEPRYTKGAIGAVSQQIAELKARSVVELDPAAIKAGGLFDRLEQDEDAHRVLMESLKTYGQQVPVLVRPDPDESGAYQIVYGRRRVAALKDLGLPVKALIRDLDDAEAIMAQGQENSARRDLSFIERVNFARQMAEAGYDRKVIGDALSTDKTLVSRMMYVSEVVPVEVIEAIGAAPGIGRDRWMSFARAWESSGWRPIDGVEMVATQGRDFSDARFEELNGWLTKRHTPQVTAAPKAAKPLQKFYEAAPGKLLGKLTRGKDRVKLELEVRHSDGFDRWLEDHLDEIYRDWKANKADGREE